MKTGAASRRAMIVTGASAGVGRALASRAAKAGFDVLAVGRRTDLLAELATTLSGSVGRIEWLALDLLSPGAASRVVAIALERFGRVDVLVNNAGTVTAGPIAEQSDAALREQFTLHVIVPLALVREALDSLRAARGQVFFVGSGVARVPVPGLGAYPSAKAAVRNAARIARAELRAYGIAVTYVDPGAVDTDFMRKAGLSGAPRNVSVSPHDVAAKILRAVETRRAVVNAAPWQTALVAIAEVLPAATDAVLARFPQIVGARPLRETGSAPPPQAIPEAEEIHDLADPQPAEPAQGIPSRFDAALQPLERKMERFKLSRDFVAKLLAPGTSLETGDVAMRWAGMPNKHERALTLEVLEALAAAGFLTTNADGSFAVLEPAGYQ